MSSIKPINDPKYLEKLLVYRVCKKIHNNRNNIVEMLAGYNYHNTTISYMDLMFFALYSYYNMNAREISTIVCEDPSKQSTIHDIVVRINMASLRNKDVNNVLHLFTSIK